MPAANFIGHQVHRCLSGNHNQEGIGRARLDKTCSVTVQDVCHGLSDEKDFVIMAAPDKAGLEGRGSQRTFPNAVPEERDRKPPLDLYFFHVKRTAKDREDGVAEFEQVVGDHVDFGFSGWGRWQIQVFQVREARSAHQAQQEPIRFVLCKTVSLEQERDVCVHRDGSRGIQCRALDSR